MDPTVWGPPAWFFLHSVTLAYPDEPTPEEKRDMSTFFQSLSKILPCHACQKHYSEHLHKYPVDSSLASKKSLVNWLVVLHNQVNLALGKATVTLPIAISKIRERYHGLGRSTSFSSIAIYSLVALVIIGLFLWWKWSLLKKIPKKVSLLSKR